MKLFIEDGYRTDFITISRVCQFTGISTTVRGLLLMQVFEHVVHHISGRIRMEIKSGIELSRFLWLNWRLDIIQRILRMYEFVIILISNQYRIGITQHHNGLKTTSTPEFQTTISSRKRNQY